MRRQKSFRDHKAPWHAVPKNEITMKNERTKYLKIFIAFALFSAIIAIVMLSNNFFRTPDENYTLEDGVPYVDGMLPNEDVIAIKEMLIRDMLAHHKKELACFLSAGCRPVGDKGKFIWLAPSKDLLDRFKSHDFPVYSTTEMSIVKGLITHATSGKQGCIYHAYITRRISSNRYIVEACGHRGPLSAIGIYFFIKKEGGKWIMKHTLESWVS